MKITWDEKTCIHAGECVRNLPQVFQVRDGQFVIEPSGASEAEIRETVSRCPSGALQVADGA